MRGGATPPEKPALPLAADEVAELLAPCAAAPVLVLAVSGGADSMALMRLAGAWARTAGRPSIHVATVDHALRAASADEAARVGTWATALGLPHATLRWIGDKPSAGLQAAARAARYALLEAHAVALGAPFVLTAHHADDQAETVLMRLARGSGPAGLAGMRPARPLGRVTLLRPFLAVPKARLLASLRACGQAWIEDPSNTDDRFARTTARRILPLLAPLGLTAERLSRLASRQARADAAIGAAATQAVERYLRDSGGVVTLAQGALAQPEEIVLRLLAAGLAAASGRDAPADLERLERLSRALARAAEQGTGLTRSAAGCVLHLRHGEVTIVREKERRRGKRLRSRPANDESVG